MQTNKHGKTVVVWNRDVNAGRNIMYVGKYQLFRKVLLFIQLSLTFANIF